jgi:nitrogen fixation protein NifU and related proteins
MSHELYQQQIKQLAADADDVERLKFSDCTASLDTPLCGDEVLVEFKTSADGRITEAGYEVSGCLLCRASLSLLNRYALGKKLGDIARVTANLEEMLVHGRPTQIDDDIDLNCFKPAQAHATRHDCVLLPFRAALNALGHSMATSRY